jgi:hypothetical protein
MSASLCRCSGNFGCSGANISTPQDSVNVLTSSQQCSGNVLTRKQLIQERWLKDLTHER